MSDVYFVKVDCNFSHWTTFNSLRQLGQNETSLQPFKFVYLCEPFCLSLSVVVFTNAPINAKPQRGGGSGICGALDHHLCPHPRGFYWKYWTQGGDIWAKFRD